MLKKPLKKYLFLIGRHSLGRSPGDLGKAWGNVSEGDKVRAFRSRGGGIGLIRLGRVASPLEPLP